MPLVLRRKEGQAILIGDGIRVEVDDTVKGSCKLLITAPREIKVLREEIAGVMPVAVGGCDAEEH
jgi:carbon storage regulator CsrA